MSLDALPEGWQKETVGNLLLSSNTGLVRGAKDQGSNKQFDYFKMNNLSVKGAFETCNLIKVDASEKEIVNYSLQYKDFIFNTRNSVELVGKCGVFLHKPTEPILFNNNLLRIRFHEIDPKLISFWFNSAEGKNQLRNITSATTSVAAIYQKALVSLDVPVPSLSEQKEIINQLDTLLSKVDSIKNHLDGIPEIIKRFRQSVISFAVNGKLTVEWRKKLSKSLWESLELEELLLESANGLSKRSGTKGDDITILRLADFKNAVRIYGKERKIKLEDKEKEKYVLADGDILVIRVNGSVDLAGRFIEYETEDSPEGFCDHFIRLRLDKKRILPKYLTYVANEGDGRYYLQNSISTSAGQNTINQGSVKGLKIQLPSIEEQKEIITIVNSFFTFADKVEQKVNAGQERVNNLAQSILAKAFRGELTSEWRDLNQVLITGENSAEALLAKIKAEREALKPKKKASRKATVKKSKA